MIIVEDPLKLLFTFYPVNRKKICNFKGQRGLGFIHKLIRMKKRASLTLLSCILLSFCFAQVQQATITQAAANAVNPLAQVIKFQMQPNYSIFHGDGQQINLVTRIITPYHGILLPFFKSKNEKIFSMARLEIPILSQTYDSLSSLNATGLGDITLSEVLAVKTSWGKMGAGPALGFPAATSPVLGSGKWTAGLVGMIMYTKKHNFMAGIVLQQFFTYAGSPSRPPSNYMTAQPFIYVIFTKGYFIMINPICTFDWQKGNYTIPLALGFGKAFAKNLSAYIMPEYIVSGLNKKSFVIQFNLNTMF